MKRAPSENELHASVAEFLDWALLPPALYTTFPAGWGKLGKATAGRLKKCGLKEGFPDLLIFHDGRCYGIELKVGKNKESLAQREMFNKLYDAGVQVRTCRSIDEVYGLLIYAGVPIRKMRLGGSHGTQRQASPQADGAGTSVT